MWRLLQRQNMQANCSESKINRNQEINRNSKFKNKQNIPEKPFCTATCARSDPRAQTRNEKDASFITLFPQNQNELTNSFNRQNCPQKQNKKNLGSSAVVKQLKSRIEILELQAQSMSTELTNQRYKENEYKNKIRSLEQCLQQRTNMLSYQPNSSSIECECPTEKQFLRERNELRTCICKLKSQKESIVAKMKVKLCEMEREKQDLKEKVKSLESKIVTSSAIETRNNNNNNNLCKDMQNLQEENNVLAKRVLTLRAKNYGLAAELDGIRTDLLTLQTENRFKKERNAIAFEEKLKEEQTKREELSCQVIFLEKIVNEMEIAGEQERQQFRKELNKSIENMYSEKLKNMELTKKFENLQNYVCDLQLLKRQLQEKQDRTVIQMSKIMLELQNELEELKSRMTTPFGESEKDQQYVQDDQEPVIEYDISQQIVVDTETERSVEEMEEPSEYGPQSEGIPMGADTKTEVYPEESVPVKDDETISAGIVLNDNQDFSDSQPMIESLPEKETSVSPEEVRKSSLQDSVKTENDVTGSTENTLLTEFQTVEPAEEVTSPEYQHIETEKPAEELSKTEISNAETDKTSQDADGSLTTDKEVSEISGPRLENISSQHIDNQNDISAVQSKDLPATEFTQSLDENSKSTENAPTLSGNISTPVEDSIGNLDVSNITNEGKHSVESQLESKESPTRDELLNEDIPTGSEESKTAVENKDPEKQENSNNSKSNVLKEVFSGSERLESSPNIDYTDTIQDKGTQDDTEKFRTIDNDDKFKSHASIANETQKPKDDSIMQTAVSKDPVSRHEVADLSSNKSDGNNLVVPSVVAENERTNENARVPNVSIIICRDYLAENKSTELLCLCSAKEKTTSSVITVEKKEKLPSQMPDFQDVESSENDNVKTNPNVESVSTNNVEENVDVEDSSLAGKQGSENKPDEVEARDEFVDSGFEVDRRQSSDDRNRQDNIDDKLIAMEINQDVEESTMKTSISSTQLIKEKQEEDKNVGDDKEGTENIETIKTDGKSADGITQQEIDKQENIDQENDSEEFKQDYNQEPEIVNSSVSNVSEDKRSARINVQLPDKSVISFDAPEENSSNDSLLESENRPRTVKFSDTSVERKSSTRLLSNTRFPKGESPKGESPKGESPKGESPVRKVCICKSCPRKQNSKLASNDVIDESEGRDTNDILTTDTEKNKLILKKSDEQNIKIESKENYSVIQHKRTSQDTSQGKTKQCRCLQKLYSASTSKSMDGENNRIVVSSGTSVPNKVTVESSEDRFLNDATSSVNALEDDRIPSTDMDGENNRIFVSSGTSVPNKVSVEGSEDRFLNDATSAVNALEDDRIPSTDMDGENNRIFVSSGTSVPNKVTVEGSEDRFLNDATSSVNALEDDRIPSTDIIDKQTSASKGDNLMKIICQCQKQSKEYRQPLREPSPGRIPTETITTQKYFKCISGSPGTTVSEIETSEAPFNADQRRRDENAINILFVKNRERSTKIACRCQYMLDIITLSVENDDNLNKMATPHVTSDICGCFSSGGIADSSSTSSLQYVDGRKCSCSGGSSSFQVQSNRAPEMELSRASNSNNKGAGSMVCETSEDCKCLVSAVLDTVLRMTASLAVLQNKCRTKDRMIQSLADELNGRSLSGVFDNLLTNLALDDSAFPTQPYDFDRIRLCEYLKKPTGFSRNSMQSTQQCIAPCPRIERFSPFDNTRMLALEDRYGTDVLMIPCKAPCSMKRSNVDDFTSECEDVCKASCSKKQQFSEPFMCERTCESSCSTGGGSRKGSNFNYNNPQQPQFNPQKSICMNGRMKDSKLTITITPKTSCYNSRSNNIMTPRKMSRDQNFNGKAGRQTMTSFSGACSCSQSSQPEYTGRGSLKTSKISFNDNDVFSSTRKNGSFSNTDPLTSSAKEYSNPSVRSGDINPYADCIPKEMTSANEIRDNSFCTDNQTYSGYGTQNVPANLETDPNIPPPMDIEVLHLTSIEALLISWRPPRIQDLHGYEVYMDGSMVKNVTRHRTTALVRGIECSCDVVIQVFTLTRTGRSLEAATCNVPFVKDQAFPEC